VPPRGARGGEVEIRAEEKGNEGRSGGEGVGVSIGGEEGRGGGGPREDGRLRQQQMLRGWEGGGC
jgi:hypothetical protein